MASWRAHEAAKQARRREQNEATARARRAECGEGQVQTFRCECADAYCTRAITLTLSEYELVRAHATRFAIARNHENPESEHVIQVGEDFAIVELVTAETMKLARRSEPRQRRREARWSGDARRAKPRQGR